MTRKVLFIIPPKHFNLEGSIQDRKFLVEFPYGVLSIASYVEKHCINVVDVKILDLGISCYQNMSIEEISSVIEHKIKELQPQFVGISILFNTEFPSASIIAKMVKETEASPYVIVGGSCATLMYSEILECENIDAVSFSEGEIPWAQLLGSNDSLAIIDSNRSFITKEKLSNGFIPEASFVENLDEIPPIDFTRVDISSYRTTRRSILYNSLEGNVDFPLITTRGCPFNCVFCTASSLHGKKVRFMTADRVISDARILKEKFGATNVNIMDDQALLYTDRAKEILCGLAELALIPAFTNGININLLDDEMLDCMQLAHVSDLSLALESGSEYVLKQIIDKPLDIHKVAQIIQKIHARNIPVKAFLVLGLPGEREEHRQETIDFVKSTGIDWVTISCAAPIRGSRLYDICVENGYILEGSVEKIGKSLSLSLLQTPDFTPEYITEKAYLMNLELNFLENYHIRNGNYNFMLQKMDYILGKYPNHAIAHYIKANVLKEMGNQRGFYESISKFEEITKNDLQWRKYAQYFKLL